MTEETKLFCSANHVYKEGFYAGVDELKSNCIEHIQKSSPLTIEEIVRIILFEAEILRREKNESNRQRQ